MPLNKKGKKILKAMKEQYGSDAKKVFYASKNKGVIKNVEKKMGGGLSGGKRFGPPPEKGPDSQGLKITKAYLGKEIKQPTETKKEFGTRHEVHTNLKESEIYRKGSKVSDASPMLKEGGMSCPYRRGGKTSIQGVSKIQVKGQQFTGVK
jgi:hypothetical protein